MRRPVQLLLIALQLVTAAPRSWAEPLPFSLPVDAPAERRPLQSSAVREKESAPVGRGSGPVDREHLGRLTAGERAKAEPVIAAADQKAKAYGLSSDQYRLTYDPQTQTATITPVMEKATPAAPEADSRGPPLMATLVIEKKPVQARFEENAARLVAGAASGEKNVRVETLPNRPNRLLVHATFAQFSQTPAGQRMQGTLQARGFTAETPLVVTVERKNGRLHVRSVITETERFHQEARVFAAGMDANQKNIVVKPVEGQPGTVSITLTALQFLATPQPFTAIRDFKPDWKAVRGAAGEAELTVTVTKTEGGFRLAAITPTPEASRVLGIENLSSGETIVIPPPAPAKVDGHAPLEGPHPAISPSFNAERIVTIENSVIKTVPSVPQPAREAHLQNYLDSFKDITSRPYVKDGPQMYVCRHFATDLARAINKDTMNPGYSAYYFAYTPVTTTPNSRLYRLFGGSSVDVNVDPSRGGGQGHAINIIEAPNARITGQSTFWVVEPQGAKIIGSFINPSGNPMPPIWFIRQFLASGFNKELNMSGGEYRIKVHGSSFNHP